jgi:ATPase family associated with various cellular activities (AAA)/Hom_end-associated Hint
MEAQESLSSTQLLEFSPPKLTLSARPRSSFIELMGWVEANFGEYVASPSSRIINNKILIDGLFVLFAKENKVKIECLYKDSLLSWRTESSAEKYFVQGVFKITYKKSSFLHCALFHKGNQNEDEIAFFNIVTSSQLDDYLEVRNKFDDWSKARDRANHFIRVIDGNDVALEGEIDWDDLFLPAALKADMKSTVETFLASKEFYLSHKIPWKRGMLLHGQPGCHSRGTDILMFDSSWKKVEDVEADDLLMGPDSKPRKVLNLIRGNEMMLRVSPKSGKPFIVNVNHILHLQYDGDQFSSAKRENLSVKDYLVLPDSVKQGYRLIKSVHDSGAESFVEINSVAPVGYDEYYGFTLDKDHLYVMEGFWITHNCGKTSLIRTIAANYPFKTVTVAPGSNTDAVREAFSYAEEQSPSLLYFEDLDSMLTQNVDLSTFLNLMDGIQAKSGLFVIATANNMSLLKSSITNRPARIDRVIEIPSPDAGMAKVYLKSFFKESIKDSKLNELVKRGVENKFSYAHFKELYVSSMFEALSGGKKVAVVADVDCAMKKMLAEKTKSSGSGINISKYTD